MTTRAAQFEILAAGVQYSADLIDTPYVKFFAAGTSDAKNAWDDDDKQSAITKKALDAQGRATVYGDGIYKLKFYSGDPDAAAPNTGTLLFEIDDYKVEAVEFSVVTKVGAYSATPDDDVILCNGTFTVTIGTADYDTPASFEHPIHIKNIGSGTITVDPYGSINIDAAATATVVPGDTLTIWPDASGNVWRSDNVLTDLDGAELILDADGDTSLRADTDDEIDFKTGGTDQMQINNAQIIFAPTGTDQVIVQDGILYPATTNDVALGNTTYRWSQQWLTQLCCNTLNEADAGSGVTIDGILLKDSDITVDTVTEKTADNGVAVDGLSIKDGKLVTADSVVAANLTDNLLEAAHGSHGLLNVVQWSVAEANALGEATTSTSYTDSTNFRWKIKLPSGPTAVRLYSYMRGSASKSAYARLDIGSEVSAGGFITDTTFGWADCGAVDVSGLTPGTVYDMVIQVKTTDGGANDADIAAISIWWE